MVFICIFLMVTGVEHCHRLNSLGSRLTGRLISSRFFQGEHLGSTSVQEKRQKHYWTRGEVELLYNGVSEASTDLTKRSENVLKKIQNVLSLGKWLDFSAPVLMATVTLGKSVPFSIGSH